MSREKKEENTIAAHLKRSGVSRRDFMQLCGTIMAAAPMGLMLTKTNSLAQVVKAVGQAKRPSVIWLHFQDCTGCSETLLRTSRPDVARPHSERDLARLSRDVDGGIRQAGGKVACRRG